MTTERDRTPEARREALRLKYKEIRGDTLAPEWAQPGLCAPIPFIGSHYGTGPRILIYASAENLNTAQKGAALWLEAKDHALDRHRYAWENGWSPKKDGRHCIGIAPFEDGPLRAAAGLLWRWEHEAGRTTTQPPTDPDALTEHVAVANFSKFAFTPNGANRDVKNVGHLRDSLPYLAADIKHLDPGIILVAKTLPTTIRRQFKDMAGSRSVVFMPQASGQALHQVGRMRAQARALGDLPDKEKIDCAETWHESGCLTGPTAWRLLLRAQVEHPME